MRKIPLDQLTEGMILGRSLYAGANLLLLAAGERLDDEYIKRIGELGYSALFVEDDDFDEVQPQEIIEETTRRVSEAAVSEGVESLAHAVHLKSEASEITRELLEEHPDVFRVPNLPDLTQAVSTILRDIIDSQVTLLDVFAEVAHSTYHYRHAVNVAVISVLLGREFGYSSRQLRELGLGALLHDFGKLCIPGVFGHPKHSLANDALERFKEHPTFGAMLLENADETLFTERLTIWHHHEWQNGKGYPQGLTGDNQPPTHTGPLESNRIFRYAEIVSIAEAYDNLVNGNGIIPRPLAPADALGTIMSFCHKRFNQAACHAMTKIICLYPTGSMVQIVDTDAFGLVGYFAVVSEQTEDTARPQVILYADPDGNRVKPKTIDFSRDQRLRLKLMV